MNKGELIDLVAQGGTMSKAQAGRAVALVLETIAQTLEVGEAVRLADFGTLTLAHRAAHSGTLNGAEYAAPARTTVRFRPAKVLLARLPAP